MGETYHQYMPLLSASYELDFWGKNRAADEAAHAIAAASRYDRATIELTIMTEIVGAYFQALQAEMAAGTATSLDVAQQDVIVAGLSAAVPPLRQQLRQTIDELSILVGQAPETFSIPPGTLAHLSEPKVRPGLPSGIAFRAAGAPS